MKNRFFLATLIVLLFSCSEEEPQPSTQKFAPGEIIIGIKPGVSIREVFNLMNRQKASIEQMSGFDTYSELSNDQLNYVIETLKTKQYLNRPGYVSGNAYVTGSKSRILITESFFEMDKVAQNDWLQTENALKLKTVPRENKHLLVKVKPGNEKLLMTLFKAEPEVEYAELNTINVISPF